MKKLILLSLLGFSQSAYTQSISQIDSISFVFCDYLNQLGEMDDVQKMNSLGKNAFNPFIESVVKDKSKQVGQQLYFRLQRNCVEFRNLLDRLDKPVEEIVRTVEKPISKITPKEIQIFKKQTAFYYLEVDGQKTKLRMKDGFWTDQFSDKTFSKLSYEWINDTEFHLTFIESNNVTRANYSVPGDLYLYQVLSKEDGFYLLSVSIPGQNSYDTIKLYY